MSTTDVAAERALAAIERRKRRKAAIESLRRLALYPSACSPEEVRAAAVEGLSALHVVQGTKIRREIEGEASLDFSDDG